MMGWARCREKESNPQDPKVDKLSYRMKVETVDAATVA